MSNISPIWRVLTQRGKGFDKIAEDMQEIVAMVDQLQELDLGDITDCIDTERKNAMREDEVVPSYDKEEILAECTECGMRRRQRTACRRIREAIPWNCIRRQQPSSRQC